LIEKQYSITEQSFVYDWTEKWFQLGDLIIDLVRDDIPPGSLPPTDLDELKYQSLRFWFIDHEEEFKSLWGDFYWSQDWAIRPGDDEIADMPDADEYIENPFFLCYRPENLYHLMRELDIQSGIDLWEPSHHRGLTALAELLQMSERVAEFFNWVDERTDEI